MWIGKFKVTHAFTRAYGGHAANKEKRCKQNRYAGNEKKKRKKKAIAATEKQTLKCTIHT